MSAPVSPVCAVRKSPSLLDYPGHLAALFYVGGCNFRCRYCHNPELMAPPASTYLWPELNELCNDLARQWVDAAVLTGGEPTTAPELPALVRDLRRRGWKIRLETNGSFPDVLEKLLPEVDCVALDVKCGAEDYPEWTGFSDVERLKASLALVRAHAADYELRTTVVEAWHTDERMDRVAQLVCGARRWVLQPFVPRPDLADRAFSNHPRTSVERLRQLRQRYQDCAKEIVIRGE